MNATFQYDAAGKRIGKSVNGTSTGYLYDGANLVQEQAGGVASANLLNGGLDEVFARTDATGTVCPLTDGVGSTLALTDTGGAEQTQYTYDAFGGTTASGSASSNRTQYTGRENDGTGLYYYRARYYSPSQHRFISQDPIGLTGGMNLYAYVGNNPLSFTDPFGLSPTGLPGIQDALAKWLAAVVVAIHIIVLIAMSINPGAGSPKLLPGLTSEAFTAEELVVWNRIHPTVTKILKGEEGFDRSMLTAAELEVAARRFLQGAAKPSGSFPKEGVVAYQYARADYLLNGGTPPGPMILWLRGNGFIP